MQNPRDVMLTGIHVLPSLIKSPLLSVKAPTLDGSPNHKEITKARDSRLNAPTIIMTREKANPAANVQERLLKPNTHILLQSHRDLVTRSSTQLTCRYSLPLQAAAPLLDLRSKSASLHHSQFHILFHFLFQPHRLRIRANNNLRSALSAHLQPIPAHHRFTPIINERSEERRVGKEC